MAIKFYYFKMLGGRGGAIRAALYHGKCDFEDVTMSWADYQAEVKADKFPALGLPVVEVDGKIITQSLAILRFAGKMSNLYPKGTPPRPPLPPPRPP